MSLQIIRVYIPSLFQNKILTVYIDVETLLAFSDDGFGMVGFGTSEFGS